MTLSSVLAGIAWDPQIRGFLATAVGVVVLMGSVYLLLATNVANRLGFLLAATGLAGWMVVLGAVWWVFGIGMVGQAAEWDVDEVVVGDTAASEIRAVRQLDTSPLPDDPSELHDLDEDEFEQQAAAYEEEIGGWEIINEADPIFGEASNAVVDHIENQEIAGIDLPDPPSGGDVIIQWAFQRGGKSGLPEDPNRFDRIYRFLRNTFWEIRNPPLYAVLQVQPVIPQEAEPGAPPPTPEPDPDQPVVSFVLLRDLGDERFPAAMITLFSAIVFGLLCNMLHRRDRRVAEARGLVPATTGT
jgi:hypothetical protein